MTLEKAKAVQLSKFLYEISRPDSFLLLNPGILGSPSPTPTAMMQRGQIANEKGEVGVRQEQSPATRAGGSAS